MLRGAAREGVPVIVFVLTKGHTYTVADVRSAAAERGLRVEVMTYDQLTTLTRLPRASYVFGDLERLPLWDRRFLAAAFRQLLEEGGRALNDPAKVRSRAGLLRQLHLAGINRFNAYRVEEGVRPTRWPVFLRSEGDHIGPLSELLHDWDAVARETDRLVAEGVPLPSLLIVEFAAEPVLPGLYRKLSAFRVGDRYLAHFCVHEDHWVAKQGKLGIATPELYADELRIMRDNPHQAIVATAFEIAGLEFGRADFGLVDGAVQIYEINDNPAIHFPTEHPSPYRLESYRLFKEAFLAALAALDTPAPLTTP